MDETPHAAVVAVLTTAPDVATAEELGGTLVEERLAACATIMPGATSIYRWEGSLARDEEVVVLLKSTRAALPALRDRLQDLHPYDLPEILAFPAPLTSGEYAEWVRSEVAGPS